MMGFLGEIPELVDRPKGRDRYVERFHWNFSMKLI